MLGAERVGSDHRDQRRVDPARQPDDHVGEAVLLHVVAGAEHQCLVHLVNRVERRRDHRLARGTAELHVGYRHLRERHRAHPTAWIERAAPERGPHVDIDDQQIFDELLGARDEMPTFVEQQRRTVEDELVLATDEVHVEHRDARVGGPGREHRLALAQPAGVVRRGVDVHDELGTTGRLGEDRPRRAPRVLADRDRDTYATDREQRSVVLPRLEVPLFVEDGVVGQEMLAVRAEDTALGAHRGRVVEVAVGLGEPDDRRGPPRARGDLLERLEGLRDERRPQQKVFRRVPGDRQLREGDEVAAGRFGAVVGVEDARRVALEVADHEVELGSGDADTRHGYKVMTPSFGCAAVALGSGGRHALRTGADPVRH